MQTLQAVIVGAVQGISEFLPISSSAHIVFAQSIYKLITGSQVLTQVGSEEIFFDIIVHLATVLAVLIFFFKDIVTILKEFFKGIIQKNYPKNSLNKNYSKNLFKEFIQEELIKNLFKEFIQKDYSKKLSKEFIQKIHSKN